MSGRIDIGGIRANLEVDSGKLEKGLADGRKAMAAIGQELRTLQAQFKAGSIGLQSYTDRVLALTVAQADLTGRMQAAYRAVGVSKDGLDIFAKGAAGASGASGRLGMAMMQLGYIADDLQYGFGSIVNNIAPLVMGLTGNVGLAAGAQVAAVAGYQLYTQWDKVRDAMGVGRVRTEAEEMEELGKATKKTADEQERLNKFKRQEKEIKEQMEARPKAEGDRAKAIEKAVTEGDAAKVVGAVAGHMVASGRVNLDDKERERIEKEVLDEDVGGDMSNTLWGMIGLSGGNQVRSKKERRAEANRRINAAKSEEAVARAERLIVDARHDPAKTRELLKLVDENPGAFPAGFAKDLSDTLPENVKQQKEWDDAGKANAVRFEAAEKTKKKADHDKKAADAKEAKAKADELQRDKDWRRDNLETAHMVMPGLDKKAEDAVLRGKIGGMSMTEIIGATAQALEEAGMSAEDAKVAAKDAIGGAAGRVDEKVANRSLREEAARSEIYDAAGLTAKIQGSIGGGDEGKKQTSLQEKMIEYLADIARKSDTNTIRLTVD